MGIVICLRDDCVQLKMFVARWDKRSICYDNSLHDSQFERL